jgi:ADP-heptose:LPS heptosyltransferase
LKISVRMEGGLGDHFAANRFIPAIKELHPDCKIDLFSDTEGSSLQSDILDKIWPSHFENIHVIKDKKYESFKIVSSNFGEELHPGNIKNVPDDISDMMKNGYDKFYDLHIDSLEWLNHDYQWIKYFNFFPTPEKIPNTTIELPDNFIMTHLYARDGADSNMEGWYIEKLIKNISMDFDIVVLYNQDSEHIYEKLLKENLEKVHFRNVSLEDIFYIASKCIASFGIDSGVRFIPYHFGKPNFVFSKYCQQYGVTQYSYLIRWLFNEKFVFPLHYDIKSASRIIKNTLKNPAYKLYPFLLDDIEKLVAQRNITEYKTS